MLPLAPRFAPAVAASSFQPFLVFRRSWPSVSISGFTQYCFIPALPYWINGIRVCWPRNLSYKTLSAPRFLPPLTSPSLGVFIPSSSSGLLWPLSTLPLNFITPSWGFMNFLRCSWGKEDGESDSRCPSQTVFNQPAVICSSQVTIWLSGYRISKISGPIQNVEMHTFRGNRRNKEGMTPHNGPWSNIADGYWILFYVF